jgi:glycosyltransferase involved in cell wall biosynthesis
LAKQDRVNRYHIFFPAGHELFTLIDQENFFFHEVPLNPASALLRHSWEQFVLPRQIKRYGIDVLFTAKNANVLLAPCKTVISIQNMEPLCFERYENEWKLNIFSWLRRVNTMISVRKADRIIAVSEATKKRLVELLPDVENRIDIIYNGNPLLYSDGNPEHFWQNSEKFLLSASKFVAYANQLNLVEAYAQLAENEHDIPPLWFAGGIHDGTYYKKVMEFVRQKNLQGRVRFLGLVPHAELMGLMNRAWAFLFPSTLEACPHTLIEAMASGVPVAASCSPPMPEICGNGAIYFDPYDIVDISEKIRQITYNTDQRESTRQSGMERSRFFNWEKTAAALIAVFEGLHNFPNPGR